MRADHPPPGDNPIEIVFPRLVVSLTLNDRLERVAIQRRPGNNAAFGHVVLALAAGQGTVTFSGGTGKFTHFSGSVVVTRIGAPADRNWAWDGTYSFDPRD